MNLFDFWFICTFTPSKTFHCSKLYNHKVNGDPTAVPALLFSLAELGKVGQAH